MLKAMLDRPLRRKLVLIVAKPTNEVSEKIAMQNLVGRTGGWAAALPDPPQSGGLRLMADDPTSLCFPKDFCGVPKPQLQERKNGGASKEVK